MRAKPSIQICDYWDQMFVYSNSFSIDNRLLVCGLSHVGEGGAKVIEQCTGDIIATLDHNFESQNKKCVRRVALTNKFIATLCGKVLCIWNKDTRHLITKEELGDRFLDSNVDLEASENLIVLANKNYHDQIFVWRLIESHLSLVREFKNDSQISPTFVLDSCRLGIILEYNPATVQLYELTELDSREVFETETCFFDGFMTLKAFKFPYFAICQYSEIYIWNIESSSQLTYFNLGNYEMCCQLILNKNFFFINLIKDQSLWENFVSGEMRPSKQILRWYQLEDFEKIEVENRKTVEDEQGIPRISPYLAKVLKNPSEIELSKRSGMEYTRDIVALSDTSIVHVADLGDAVTFYNFWSNSD